MGKTDTKKLLEAVVAALEDKKGEDISILELDPSESALTDYFVLVSGGNPRQVQTLAESVEHKLKQEFGQMANSREGYRQAEWVLLDYVDFVVHVFSEEKRAFYGIERLRKSARAVSPAELRAALAERTVRARAGRSDSAPDKGSKSPKAAKGKKADAVTKLVATARKKPVKAKSAIKKSSGKPASRKASAKKTAKRKKS
jgi:ribosome-associated protein